MLADLTAMAPLDRRRWVLGHAITPALAELPPMPSEAAARVMLLAIAGVESGCYARVQVPVAHARGLWQFERGGGVAGVLADPQLALVPAGGSTVVASNNDWDATAVPSLATAFAQAGAFAFPVGSKDAALLFTTTPDATGYTATVSGVGGQTGTALVDRAGVTMDEIVKAALKANVTPVFGTA